jgi:hypothetical protein
MGFVLEPDEAAAMVEADPRNADVLFPYLDGDNLNSSPETSASRWVIDFTGYCEKCAARHAEPFERVLRLVRPQRAKNKRAARRDRWWQFAEKALGIRQAIAGLDEVLAIARVSKTVMPVRVTTRQVFHEKLVVFATDSFAEQAVLSSSLHQIWAIKYGTTMRIDPTYTPSTVFETFPRPEISNVLSGIGRTLDAERREIMVRRGLGLTDLYNLVNDPETPDSADRDVARVRKIHVELDHAVMDAYGWGGVPLDHGYHSWRQMTRWTVGPKVRVEILDLLLEENHRRAAAQGEPPPPVEDEEDEDEGDEE